MGEDTRYVKMKLNGNIISSAKELQEFTDHFPSMLGYWDKNLLNRHANRAYAAYFGMTPQQIRGKSIRKLLGAKLFNMNRPYMIAALAGDAQTFERKIQTPSGKIIYTLATYIPHREKRKVEGFFVIVTDISKVVELQEKNLQLQETLAAKSRLSAVGEMAAGIAHEINNPLTIIYANACQLSRMIENDNFDKKKLGAAVREIEETSLRIEKIVDGLRSMVRDGEHDPKQDSNVAQIVAETIAICESRCKKRKVRLEIGDIPRSLNVRARQVQVSQIILNLLNNALDAVLKTKTRRIRVAVGFTKSTVTISVSNSGPKIPAEIARQIFEPFYTTKGPHKGAGLGLSISKNLAKSNNGSLTLENSKLVTFKLTLPRAPSRGVSR